MKKIGKLLRNGSKTLAARTEKHKLGKQLSNTENDIDKASQDSLATTSNILKYESRKRLQRCGRKGGTKTSTRNVYIPFAINKNLRRGKISRTKRNELPIAKPRDDFLHAISDKDTVVVCGETGR